MQRAWQAAGIRTEAAPAERSRAEVLALHRVGARGMETLAADLARRGLSLRAD